VLRSKDVALKFTHSFVNWWLKLCCVNWFDCKCAKYFVGFLTTLAVGKKCWDTISTLWGAKPVHSYRQSTCSRVFRSWQFYSYSITGIDCNCHCVRLLTGVWHEILSQCFCHKVYTLNCVWLWVIRDRVNVCSLSRRITGLFVRLVARLKLCS
jgi:hypothetical protein